MKKKNRKLKKSQRKANQSKLAKQRKAQGISRLLTIAILAGIGLYVYQDVYADGYADDSRYATGEELLELEQEAIEIEKQYQGLPKQIVVCWSESQHRLVPAYQGCK